MTLRQSGEVVLAATGLGKRYGAVAVLRDVDFELRAGEVHALVGANGAGKSTLCKIFAGLVQASGGGLRLLDAAYAPASKQDAERSGVQMVHQELNLIPTLSVAENLLLTALPVRWGFAIRKRELLSRASEILGEYGLDDIDAQAPAGSLGVGRQQMVEIAGVLARQSSGRGRVLLLDEPTAALGPSESKRLFGWIDALREQGVAIVYVSHRLAEVIDLVDRVTVLRDGECVLCRSAAGLEQSELVTAMSGARDAGETEGVFQSHAGPEIALRVDRLCTPVLSDLSFAVRRGERFGIAGLVGSGRSELLRAIFGADSMDAGTVQVGEHAAGSFRSPSEATAAGIALVTENRGVDGLLLAQSVRANTTLRALRHGLANAGVVRAAQERQAAQREGAALSVRCASLEQPVSQLSGGNQQKVAIAKWLVREAPNVDVLLFDEPTRGIDVAARARIHELFGELTAAGKTLVIVSSDEDELFEVCDRIAVLSNGRLVHIFERGEWSEERVLEAAFSGYARESTGRRAAGSTPGVADA